MFERFTEKAIKVIMLAQEEAFLPRLRSVTTQWVSAQEALQPHPYNGLETVRPLASHFKVEDRFRGQT